MKVRKNNYNPDILIVGAGPVGCVLSEQFTNKLNLNTLIVEKRNHIAGNCYDLKNKKDLLYHKYGPHYLRFKKKSTYNYLSKFTKWIDGNYIVKSNYKNNLYPFPINLTTLEKFFKVKFKTPNKARQFLKIKKIKFKKITNSEEFVLSKVGRELYEAFYKNYTIKQWSQHPKNLSKEICGRIPIRFNRNFYYVNEKMKYMPKHGYTKMFEKMINNKRTSILLNTDYFKIKSEIKPKYLTIYCGPVDKYFKYKYGKLQWRSLDFKFFTYKKKKHQDCVQINYPNEKKYTRSVEIKHVTKQKSNYTIMSYEYPKSGGDPYYPINNKRNSEMYKKYKNLVLKETKKNVYFEGRLARYKYMNTDEVIESALSLFMHLKKIIKKNEI